MIGIILSGILGIICGAIIIYFLLSPKVKKVEQLNNFIKEENQKALKEYQETDEKLKCSQKELSEIKINISNCEKQLENTNKQNQEAIKLLSQQRAEAQNAADGYKNKCMEAAKADLKLEQQKFNKAKENYKNEYLLIMDELVKTYKENITNSKQKYNEISEKLNDIKQIFEAALENARRAAAEDDKKEFYQLQVSNEDLYEIKRLRDIIPYFRNSRPIGKIIWESYYRTATNDLINRLEIKDNEVGIYKITNLLNKKIYVGQSVNLSNRIKDHIKCGCGIDTPNNILYKAMLKDGIENFIFEKIENCSREKLNDREKYWIDYFHSQEYGYNMTSGGSKN